jgi:hypothetical protein
MYKHPERFSAFTLKKQFAQFFYQDTLFPIHATATHPLSRHESPPKINLDVEDHGPNKTGTTRTRLRVSAA